MIKVETVQKEKVLIEPADVKKYLDVERNKNQGYINEIEKTN